MVEKIEFRVMNFRRLQIQLIGHSLHGVVPCSEGHPQFPPSRGLYSERHTIAIYSSSSTHNSLASLRIAVGIAAHGSDLNHRGLSDTYTFVRNNGRVHIHFCVQCEKY